MKRAYEIGLERRENWQAFRLIVVANTDEEAVRKAKSCARRWSGIKSGWRCVRLQERGADLVA